MDITCMHCFQIFPGNLLPSTYYDQDTIRARTEVERREKYIALLDAHIGAAATLALAHLIKQCLRNRPKQRPSTEELLTRLQGMRAKVGEHGVPIKVDLAMARLTEVKEKAKRIEVRQCVSKMTPINS